MADDKAIWAAIKDLRRRVTQKPDTILSVPVQDLVLVIVGGNTLETGQPGVVYEATVSSVPSAYDPNVTSTFIDGIGRATLYRNGVAQEGYVLVVNSDDGTWRNAAFQNDPIISSGTVSIPVSGGDETVRAYTLGT